MKPRFSTLPPLSLYVHIPWCIRKCPYCDFNSHARAGELPLASYANALMNDLKQDAPLAQGRKLESIFIGGGTPSLMPGELIADVIACASAVIGVANNCEITLEANPGTAEFQSFSAYQKAGVNRLSLGAQSFDATQLQKLGRIHSPQEITRAFSLARDAGIDNINLDLMFGLVKQTDTEALQDLSQAIDLKPEHISWYQLTIEKNTAFYSQPPVLPDDDALWEIQQAGQALLSSAGYQQYEISAYEKNVKPCKHNMNYWHFGDYMAIGAGAHGKITRLEQQELIRYRKTRQPEHYLARSESGTHTHTETVAAESLAFEFMMNTLRLRRGAELCLFSERTGLPATYIEERLRELQNKELLEPSDTHIRPTPLGLRYLNNLLEHFL